MSAQRTDHNRRSWTMCPLLRIRWRLLLSVVSFGGGRPGYVGFKQYAAYVGDIHNADQAADVSDDGSVKFSV
jgi:hypothetical protein